MKKARKASLIAVSLILGTFLLTRWWLNHPDVGPQVPLPLAEWLINVYGSKDGEDLADLEVLFALFLSFVTLLFLTAVVWLIKRQMSTRS